MLTYVYVGDKNSQRSELNKTFTIKSQESKITANNIIDYQDQTVTLTVKIVGAKTGINAASIYTLGGLVMLIGAGTVVIAKRKENI